MSILSNLRHGARMWRPNLSLGRPPSGGMPADRDSGEATVGPSTSRRVPRPPGRSIRPLPPAAARRRRCSSPSPDCRLRRSPPGRAPRRRRAQDRPPPRASGHDARRSVGKWLGSARGVDTAARQWVCTSGDRKAHSVPVMALLKGPSAVPLLFAVPEGGGVVVLCLIAITAEVYIGWLKCRPACDSR